MKSNFSNEIKLGNASKLQARYEELATERSQYVTRGQEYSRLTLKYLLPVTTPRSGAANQHGFQSHGAQVMNHLANKLVLTLFPPQRSFFLPDLTEESEGRLKQAGYSKTDLAELTTKIVKKAEKMQGKVGMRVGLTEGFKHILASGNVCLYLPRKGNMQALPLDRYVVKRDSNGELVELITLQEKTLSTFTPALQAAIRAGKGGKNKKLTDKVKLYTQAKLEEDGMWLVQQAAEDVPIGEKSRLKKRKLPWIVLRWNSCYGEDYGRGLVEDHSGDFYVAEFLSEALIKGCVLMADIKYLVKPGSVTDIQHLIESPAGEYITGNRDDIGVLQLEKYADFTPIREVLNDYQRRIGQAFLMNSANRRDAERVTTYELRLDASELETSLGGAYSLFAQTLQPPLAMLLLEKTSPEIGDLVEPNILTGLDALGRVGDLDKIAQFNDLMTVPQNWPQDLQSRMKWSEYAKTAAAALSMEIPWIMTDEEFSQAQAQARQAQQQDVLTGELAKAGGKAAAPAMEPMMKSAMKQMGGE